MVNIADDIKKSIVQIRGKREDGYCTIGTGFVISSEGHIATCTHVLSDCISSSTFKIVFHYDMEEEHTISACVEDGMSSLSTEEDISILKPIKPPTFKLYPVMMCDRTDLNDLKIQTFGFAQIDSFRGIHSEGELIGNSVFENDLQRIQARLQEVEEGFSGAPVWCKKTGEVIGMICKIVNPSEKLRNIATTFIIPVKNIRDIYSNKNLLSQKGLKKIKPSEISKEYVCNWHVFSPFALIRSFKDVKQKFNGFQVSEIEGGHRITIEDGKDIYWFNNGVAIWHISQQVTKKRIHEFSFLRRSLYRELLEEGNELNKKSRKILELVHETDINIQDLTSNCGYAFSFVELLTPAWEGDYIENALKLFANPSILVPIDYYDGNSIVRTGVEESEVLLQREINLLKNGISDSEYSPFEVADTTQGFACWSGISAFFLHSTTSDTVSQMIQFEISLQNLWWYFSHFKELLLKGQVDFVSAHFSQNNIKEKFTKLIEVPPREPAILRIYKEAAIKTSRIKEVYNDFKETLIEYK